MKRSIVRWVLSAILFVAFAVTLLYFFFAENGGERGDLLAYLPAPDEEAPYVVARTRKGEFPLQAARILADSASVSPGGSSPLYALLPLFDTAENAALVAVSRENGLVMYAALEWPESDNIGDGVVPTSWLKFFVRPEVIRTDIPNRLQIRAHNISSPLYLEIVDSRVFAADAAEDMDRIRALREHKPKNGIRPASIPQRARTDEKWGGALSFSDGGILAAVSDRTNAPPVPANALTAEICWRVAVPVSPDISPAGVSEIGEAQWSVSGLERILGKPFLSNLKGYDWSANGDVAPFIPEPTILSFGINMPPRAKIRSGAPKFLEDMAEHLDRFKLKNADTNAILTGPAVASIGGRTQILWFELPGIVLDLPKRGDAGRRLVERFWSELFTGTTPKPLDGFDTGGTSDLPFSVMAAANDERARLALAAPDMERNAEVLQILSGEKNAAAWAYFNLPRLGASLSEIPIWSNIMYNDPDEEGTEETEEDDTPSTLRDALHQLGRLFISFESASNGRALWYY